MRIDILTLFPEMFDSYMNASILGRAQASNILQLHRHNIRDYTTDKHHIADLPPFGGGGGMVLKPEPIFKAVEAVISEQSAVNSEQIHNSQFTIHNSQFPIILLSPQGRVFTQEVAQELAAHERLILICGRYEGVDERVRQGLVTDEISIGDYVLTGGELAAMVVVDAVTRLLPGALGTDWAAAEDSHATGLLEGAHYTKPAVFRGMEVPAILRSGHTGNIHRWRREQAIRRTWQRRPELLLTAELTAAEKQYLANLAVEWVETEEK